MSSPPKVKEWVDEIRELGDDANHELISMDKSEAEELITLRRDAQMTYEFPAKAGRSMATREARDAGTDD